jgi:hypothetical protein
MTNNTGTSIKSGGGKLVFCKQTSPKWTSDVYQQNYINAGTSIQRGGVKLILWAPNFSYVIYICTCIYKCKHFNKKWHVPVLFVILLYTYKVIEFSVILTCTTHKTTVYSYS